MVRLLPKTYTYEPVPVSLHFQAQLPPWADKTSNLHNSDDLKWLGTPIWPQDNQKHSQFEKDPIGKGRQDNCVCKHPGSVECARFHIAQKRFKLKHELGSAFHSWKFNCMGEEVALAWTEEEARKFKVVVRLNPPSGTKNFWYQLQLAFPSKRKKDLVSYYTSRCSFSLVEAHFDIRERRRIYPQMTISLLLFALASYNYEQLKL